MIGQYISAFLIFIIFIDDWDLSENNTDHLATPARLSIRHPPPPPLAATQITGLRPELAFRLNLSSDVNTVSQCLTALCIG